MLKRATLVGLTIACIFTSAIFAPQVLSSDPSAETTKSVKIETLSLELADQMTTWITLFGMRHGITFNYHGPLGTRRHPQKHGGFIWAGSTNSESSGSWIIEVFDKGVTQHVVQCTLRIANPSEADPKHRSYRITLPEGDLELCLIWATDAKHKVVSIDDVICQDKTKLTRILTDLEDFCLEYSARKREWYQRIGRSPTK